MTAHGDLATASDGTRTSENKRVPFTMRVVRMGILLVATLAVIALAVWLYCVRMPGESFVGAAPTPTTADVSTTCGCLA